MSIQRLIRVNCPNCKKPYTPSPSDLEQIEMAQSDIESTTYYRGEKCDNCHQTGFQGRLGLYELLKSDEAMREMMEAGTSINVIRDAARRKGMTTLREEGIDRIIQGVTSVEEVLRTT